MSSQPETGRGLEAVQESRIGRWKFVMLQPAAIDPCHGCTAKRVRFPAGDPGKVKTEMNGFGRVGMDHFLEERAYFRVDSEFFLQFPPKAFLPGLAWLTLASGKLPQP